MRRENTPDLRSAADNDDHDQALGKDESQNPFPRTAAKDFLVIDRGYLKFRRADRQRPGKTLPVQGVYELTRIGNDPREEGRTAFGKQKRDRKRHAGDLEEFSRDQGPELQPVGPLQAGETRRLSAAVLDRTVI